MKKKVYYQKDFEKFVQENTSVVRDNFSGYLETAKTSPVIVLERNRPKSVIINYDLFAKTFLKGSNSKIDEPPRKSKKRFTSARDFIGVINPERKKINIKKEIEDAWTEKFL